MKKMILVVGGLCVCCFGQVAARAETIVVDPNGFADYITIQEAIDHSWDGDTIIVKPGTYHESISFYGLQIILRSIEPTNKTIVESTVIWHDDSSAAVKFDSGETSSAILEGLTIQGGSPVIYCYYSNPTIKSCMIKGDGYYSRGIEGEHASPTILDCTVKMQHDISDAIIWCDGLISGCLLTENGIGLEQCHGVIENCVISNNSFAGMASCDAIVRNCLIVDNGYGSYSGGGIKFPGGGSIINCTIAYNDGVGLEKTNQQLVKNCIIAYNTEYGVENGGPTGLEYNNLYGNVISNYNNVPPGSTDLHRNPEFYSRNNYHLKSQYGRWDKQTETWVIDEVTSRCIDAGNPTDEIGQEPNPNGGRINIGAYGGTLYASKGATDGQEPEPNCINPPQMDTNNDCQINMSDFAVFAAEWLACGYADQSDCQ